MYYISYLNKNIKACSPIPGKLGDWGANVLHDNVNRYVLSSTLLPLMEKGVGSNPLNWQHRICRIHSHRTGVNQTSLHIQRQNRSIPNDFRCLLHAHNYRNTQA